MTVYENENRNAKHINEIVDCLKYPNRIYTFMEQPCALRSGFAAATLDWLHNSI